MSGLNGLMEKMNTKVKVLGPFTAPDGSFRPSDARLVIRIDDGGTCLRETKVVKKFAKINNFLNQGRSRNILRFSRR